MANYRHIVAAVDLTEEAPIVLERARDIAAQHGARLSIITVIRPLNSAYAGLDPTWLGRATRDFEEEARQHTAKRLQELAAELDVAADETHVFFGPPAAVIRTQSEAVSKVFSLG